MKDSKLSLFAGVTVQAISNYRAWKAGDETRKRYVSVDDRSRIERYMKLSQTRILFLHFTKYGDNAALTQAQAGTDYHIGRLSERVREVNARLAATGSPRRIVNRAPLGRGQQAEYVMVDSTGDGPPTLRKSALLRRALKGLLEEAVLKNQDAKYWITFSRVVLEKTK